ncbi:GDNF family receptor alpha-1b [Myxocyprinus asiaticus]|uniref:GDNF family receptor alpha-1b n=1 Tax=Myxocyprinus asiaticus TaxID=70543 RepID=UPI002223ABEE|nr:GDNF family receptor alpha-1b [Myxocyprinus asiaticus]
MDLNKATMIFVTFWIMLSVLDLMHFSQAYVIAQSRSVRLDCVRAHEQCLGKYGCSTKYRTMRQCVAGKASNFTMLAEPEAQDECRNAIESMKQSPLYDCKCRRGMKKEKNCLRIFWSIYQSLQANDLLEDSPYEPVNSRLSDIFRLAPIISGEAAFTKDNNCLNAAKACNLNDTCKKYRSSYINPCTSRVSTTEVCNKRKCHKALRQFFDKVPPKHSYGMLFCSCPSGDHSACSERRRQTIVPACSYEDKEKPNCLSLQASCKTNYICRSRLADFLTNCQPETRSISGCLKENYANCLLAYSGLIGTVMTPNYLRAPGISVSPWCDCSSSGNGKAECDKFTEFFTNNRCLRNAIQAFGNGTDVGMWQPQPPIMSTPPDPYTPQRGRDRTSNALDDSTHTNGLDTNADRLYSFCGSLQAQKLKSNVTPDALCVDPLLNDPSSFNAIPRSSTSAVCSLDLTVILLCLAFILQFGQLIDPQTL